MFFGVQKGVQNRAKSVKNWPQNGPKTCFGDFSAIMHPMKPVPTPWGAKRIVLCVANSFREFLEQKAVIFRDFMAAEVLESAGLGMAGIDLKWAKSHDFRFFGDYACCGPRSFAGQRQSGSSLHL